MAMRSATKPMTPMMNRTILPKVSTDDDTDISPEPSPFGPPAPTRQQDFQSEKQQQLDNSGPWTPRQPSYHRTNRTAEDDGSLSTLPEIPSPYSPPPASLFSGEEWPPRTAQKPSSTERPPSEVQLSNSQNKNNSNFMQSGKSEKSRSGVMAIHNNASFDVFGNLQQQNQKENSPVMPMTHTSVTSSATDRSHVLPTVMYLKKSLQESHQAQYLLRQENNSLAMECDRFQEEVLKWQTEANDATKIAQEREAALRETFQNLTRKNESLLNEQNQLREDMQTLEQGKHSEAAKLKEDNAKLQELLKEIETQNKQLGDNLKEERAEKDKLSKELLLQKTSVCGKEEQQKSLSAQIEKLTGEIRDLRNRVKTQANGHIDQVKQLREEHEEIISALKKENTSANHEISRLKAMVHENKLTTKQLAAEKEKSADLQEKVASLDKKLKESQKINAKLSDEVGELKEAKDGETAKLALLNSKLKEEVKELKNELKQANIKINELNADGDAAKEVEKLLKSDLQNANSDVTELRNEADRLQSELIQLIEKNNELQSDYESLQAEFEELKESLDSAQSAGAEKDEDIQRVTNLLEKSEEERKQHQKFIDELKDVCDDLKTKESEANAEKRQLNERIGDLKDALDESDMMISDLKQKLLSMQETAASKKSSCAEAACQTEAAPCEEVETSLDDSVFTFPGSNPIANRFKLIQNSSERATLIKEYRQELALVRKEYEQEIKFLTATHDQNLKQILHEAKLELKARIKENKHRINLEVQKQVADMQLKHQDEIDKLNEEYGIAAEKSEEALQAAIAEVSLYTKQLDEQSAARDKLERTVRDLERQLAVEQQKSKRAKESLLSRKKWQEETNRVITSIQLECNSVFGSKMVEIPDSCSQTGEDLGEGNASVLERSETGTSSSTIMAKNNNIPTRASNLHRPMPEWNAAMSSSEVEPHPLQSPILVNKTLDETEALVQSLLGEF